MKQIFHKIASTFLALIVLFSSFSFMVNKHICGGEVVNTTLFIDADNCGMDMQICENKTLESKASIEKEPCCKDISELIQGNDNNQQAQVFHLSISQMEFVKAFVYTFINNLKIATTSVAVYVYKPPLVLRNIQTFFQVFRI